MQASIPARAGLNAGGPGRKRAEGDVGRRTWEKCGDDRSAEAVWNVNFNNGNVNANNVNNHNYVRVVRSRK